MYIQISDIYVISESFNRDITNDKGLQFLHMLTC